jgi:hypothetical protein
MVNIPPLTGLYKITGTKLRKEDQTGYLQIVTRKEVTPSKPELYIVSKTPENPRGQYVSSMYQTDDPKVYRIETGGKHYAVKYVTPETVTIDPWQTDSPYINHYL